MFWTIQRYFENQKKMKMMSKDIIIDNTWKVVTCVVLIGIFVFFILINVAYAETMTWQIIKTDRDQYIKVIYEYPENMQLGDKISFYCEFQNCTENDFNYTWQYSSNGELWTNFGNQSRKDTTYCSMLAGNYVRLVVERK